MSPVPAPTSAPTSAPASVVAKSQQSTPTLSHSPYTVGPTGGVVYGPHPRPLNGVQVQKSARNVSGGSTPSDSQLVDVPSQLFYPFYPEQVGSMSAPNGGSVNASNNGNANGGGGCASGAVANGAVAGTVAGTGNTGGNGNGHQRDYSGLLAAAANTFGYQSSQDSFVSEERDPKPGLHQQGMQMWVNAVSILRLTCGFFELCADVLFFSSRGEEGQCRRMRPSHDQVAVSLLSVGFFGIAPFASSLMQIHGFMHHCSMLRPHNSYAQRHFLSLGNL
jgi:hypothetical protein